MVDAMASSSIEVMAGGAGEVKVMLMDDGVDDGTMAEEMQTIITSDAAQGHLVQAMEATASQEEDFPDVGSEFHTLEGMEPPPGTIIFSPQDLMRPTKPMRGGKSRGGGRSALASVKQEPGAPPTLGGSQTLEMPVACEVCGKVMMTGKTLVQHMAIHSDLKPFQCPHCPKSFARKVHLQGHLVVHGIEKQFECPVCHQRFSRQDCVKVHMRLHDKSKCVYCDVCHKAFLTVGALNIHLRIHRGEKPFKCHLCGKCFTQKNHLITHIKRHTKVTDEHFTKKLGPRMFKCEHCPRSFIRLSDYERHVQWNHGAIAEGSVVDKLPTVGNLLEGETKQTGLAPQIFKVPKDALNSKPKTRRPKKVMCNTSTQTDEEGGHVIIPRQYQVSAATQVSAPPTPRPAEDDMYENDIFDEGMDRNYSSDEDEALDDTGEEPAERKVFPVPESSEMASDPIQDAAFDAMVQGNAKPSAQTEGESTDDQHAAFLQEVVSTLNKQQEVIKDTSEDNEATGETTQILNDKESENVPNERLVSSDYNELAREASSPEKVIMQSTQDAEPEPMERVEDSQVLAFDLPEGHKNKSGLVPVSGRKPRGRKKSVFGLSGAAELRAIRKNMMKSLISASEAKSMLSAAAEEAKIAEEETEEEVVKNMPNLAPEEGETEGRGKRMAKNKQHGKDFVCNMKSCETCFSSPKSNPKMQPKFKVKVEKKTPEKAEVARKVIPITKEPIRQLIREITKVSEKRPMDEMELEEKRMKMDHKFEEPKMKVDNRVGSYPVDITASPLTNKTKKEDFFVATSNSDSIVSPPVELMSFCIPTYSCKLCGREFRFEGKLHRHIESVHQNKAIFSPDVKPGRGSSKVVLLNNTEVAQPQQVTTEPENPEIAALRSEWDDDDDEEEEEAPMPAPTIRVPVSTVTSHHQPITIITRDIAPVTTTVTDAYSSGVKVNMNKLAGLLPPGKTVPVVSEGGRVKQELNAPVVSSSVSSSQPREPETIMADTLDMKCRRLLEKLFDHDLLMNCGLLEEHVSVVLGRVLQHYGVKMIEDYGQGQYEVLKYNLWRLIEWKVTMEQMEEFYTAGKSVEEMMDDIMNERVPIVSHHFVPQEQAAHSHVQVSQAGQVTQVEAVDVGDGQMVLQQVTDVLGGQINLPAGVTQVVLAQDVPPDLLQGAHIVTIDPATGQVISQVTADQVILTEAIGDELEQQVAALDGQVVVSQAPASVHSIVSHASSVSAQATQAHLSHGHVIVPANQQTVKMESANDSTGHPSHQHQQ